MKSSPAGLALALLGSCALVACATSAPPENPVTVYRAHKAALARGDAAAAMSYLTEDITYAAGPGCPAAKPCVGTDQVLRNFVGRAAEQKMQVMPVDAPRLVGEATRNPVTVSWNGIEQLGVRRIRGHDDVTVRDGKLASVVFTPDMTDPQTARLYGAGDAPSQPK